MIDEARRQATRLREAAASPPRRAPAGAARRGLRAGRGRGGARRWRRGGGWSCAPSRSSRVNPARRRAAAHPRRVVEPHTTLRAELHQARVARRPARGQGEVDIGAPLRDRAARAGCDAATACASSRPTGRTPTAWSALLRALGLGDRRRAAARGRASRRSARRAGDGPAAGRPERIAAARVRAAGRSPGRRRRGGDLRGARAARGARQQGGRRSAISGEIAEGDAVVHDEHGIGRYRGLKKLTVRGVPAGLHAPRVRRRLGLRARLPHRRSCTATSGGEAGEVKLDKLGGATWQEKRRRVSAEARKIAEELLQLYAQRAALAGHAFPPPDAVFRAFEETFPFDETPDQAKAIETVLADMQNGVPMDRLICGDVGYGKTEVALRASLLAVLGGKQVAVLAPTTVLAEQHFVTFSERLRRLPGAGRGAVALPQQGRAAEDGGGAGRGQDRRRRRHAPRCCRATSASRTSACWSSTRSSASASPTRSASRSCARRSTC